MYEFRSELGVPSDGGLSPERAKAVLDCLDNASTLMYSHGIIDSWATDDEIRLVGFAQYALHKDTISKEAIALRNRHTDALMAEHEDLPTTADATRVAREDVVKHLGFNSDTYKDIAVDEATRQGHKIQYAPFAKEVADLKTESGDPLATTEQLERYLDRNEEEMQRELGHKFMVNMARTLAQRIGGQVVPMGLNMCVELFIYDCIKGVSGFTGEPMPSELLGYPDVMYSLFRMELDKIVPKAFGEDFAEEYELVLEQIREARASI
jgi:hypothetical protein